MIYIAGCKDSWVCAFLGGIIAVTFNPLVTIHFTRAIWAPIDWAAAAVLAAAALKARTGK